MVYDANLNLWVFFKLCWLVDKGYLNPARRFSGSLFISAEECRRIGYNAAVSNS